jgi:prevent-host-death family protein
MREIQASEAKTHLPRLLRDVERGETIVITRHGRAIARLVPETDKRRADALRAIAELRAFRKKMPRLTREDILRGRHAGHKY